MELGSGDVEADIGTPDTVTELTVRWGGGGWAKGEGWEGRGMINGKVWRRGWGGQGEEEQGRRPQEFVNLICILYCQYIIFYTYFIERFSASFRLSNPL